MRRALATLVFLLPPVLMAGGNGAVTAKGHRFTAEVAVSEAERAQGLMGRHELASDRCMIFLYTEDGPHPIWMKNCFISLDVAWTDKDGKVVELVPDVPPPSPIQVYANDADYPNFGGKVDSRHFIEFPQGTFKRIGLKVGDRIGWDLKLDDGTLVKDGAAEAMKGAKLKKK
ncbi:MAG TPA: DUF192 domain-containing protein [Holophagaceae bacterium]|jgi:uncharacterized membrane protein (UPF0127 family)|nr:DUF192 domain-containing protein [Holophagaceae bacterium]